MGDRLADIFARQFEQQEAIYGGLPLTRDERRDLARELAQYSVGEIYSYLDAIAYKRFLSSEELPRSSRVTELIDAFKYILALMWLEGVSAAELHDEFMRKSAVVDSRRAEVAMTTKVAGFDIDGVLCCYSPWEPDEETFVERGGALALEPMPGALGFLQKLKGEGWTIVLVSARKVYRHTRLEADTIEWLAMHQFPYDKLLWGYDKMEQIKRFGASFDFFVEDSLKHAIDVATSGTKVYLLGGDQELVYFRQGNIIPVPDWWRLMEHFDGQPATV